MNKLIVLVLSLTAALAVAQTCILPAPVKPPTPTQLIVTLPVDGGTVGCTVLAVLPSTAPGAAANAYAISNAKCATSVQIAKQAAANDNGWNDGGVP